jgi:hypothetical protein
MSLALIFSGGRQTFTVRARDQLQKPEKIAISATSMTTDDNNTII